MGKLWCSIILLSFTLTGCGAPDDDGFVGSGNAQIPSGIAWALKAFDPIYRAYDFDEDHPSTLLSVNRHLPLHMFEGLVEPDLSVDKKFALSVVTGVGLKAEDAEGDPIAIKLGIYAREYNPQTGQFGSEARLFAAAGTVFESSQEFIITNTNSSNYVFTGMGFRVANGVLSKLAVQKKTMNKLNQVSVTGMPSDTTSVVLPPNWVMVGMVVKFTPNETSDPFPFASDAILYTALWAPQ